MLKTWLLRIHRWTTLVFAIPFALLIATGLILSFEPMVIDGGAKPLGAETLNAVLAKHDPEAKARSLVIRSYAGTVSIGGAQRGQMTHVDLASNEKIASPGFLADMFSTSRRLHETFLYELGWFVTTSTVAMLVMIALGVLMGWPRLRNTLAGWHKGTGWFLLPLLILSPLTGLFLAFGVTFSPPLTRPTNPAPIGMAEAARIVAATYGLGQVSWIRPLGGTLVARLNNGGEMRIFTVTREGLLPASRNWPRLLHEGNWSRHIAPAINVVISAALVLLLTTGLWIWARRKFRRRPVRAGVRLSAAPKTDRPVAAG
jgi:hypothetical protein